MTQLAEAITMGSIFYSREEAATKLGIRTDQVQELAGKYRQIAELGSFGQWRYKRSQIDQLAKHPSHYLHLFPEKEFSLKEIEYVLYNHCGGMTLEKLAIKLEAEDLSEETPDERLIQMRTLLKAATEAGKEMVNNLEKAFKALNE